MSEFQYYEFQTIDRPLSEKEQAQISTISSRVELTPTQAVFTYRFGDFRGKPEEVLEKYFDALLYLASWGTQRLMFRFPRSVINAADLAPYGVPHVISTSVTKAHVILDIRIDDETSGYWVEGAGKLSSLMPLRQDLLQGDFRVLYLAWLKAIELEGGLDHSEEDEAREDFDGDDEFEIAYDKEKSRTSDLGSQSEPPVPANLGNLSTPLNKFVKIFEVDQDLLARALIQVCACGRSPANSVQRARRPHAARHSRKSLSGRNGRGLLRVP